MKLGTETANLHSWMMGGATQPEPKVGDGATILYWTDRRAGTITKVTPTMLVVQLDTVTRIDEHGMSDDQHYEYAPNPDGARRVFRKTKRGWRESGGGAGLAIGIRDEFYDYSF